MAIRKTVRRALGREEDRQESAITSGAARDRAAPEDEATIRDRLSDAKRAAKRKLGGRPESDITAGAKPDKTASRGVRGRLSDLDREDARRAARVAAERVSADPVDTSVNQDGEEVARRAENAATMADPMNTTLEPADPMAVESMATAGGRGGEDGAEPAEPMFDWGLDAAGEAREGDGASPPPVDDMLGVGGDGPKEDPLAVDDDDDLLGFGGER